MSERRSEPDDMRRVDFKCHPEEPVRVMEKAGQVMESWKEPVHCLICGSVCR